MSDEQNETQEIQETTEVGQVEVDVDALFGQPGAENIMLPDDGSQEEKKPSFFSKEDVSIDFLDKKTTQTKTTTPASTEDEQEKPLTNDAEGDIDELNRLINDEEDSGNVGRPKLDKSALMDLTSKMIEEGTLYGFDDDKPLEDYSVQDYRALLEANFDEREAKLKERLPQEFFLSLPEELQIAAKYVADGGQDLKGLFKTLSEVTDVVELNMDNERDHPEIARQYLYATRFGSPEEIEDQIAEWEDLGVLNKKAGQFKPKLDKMQESIVANKLREQEMIKAQQENAAKAYMDDVYDVLVGGELDGIKLDKKTQSMLYSGLVQPNYPSMSGKPTNLLGHLLEKYQFVEPNHSLIAEALWLLQDPTGYKERIKQQGSAGATEEIVRKLKTEESRKSAASSVQEEKETRRPSSKRTIKRQGGGFFKR